MSLATHQAKRQYLTDTHTHTQQQQHKQQQQHQQNKCTAHTEDICLDLLPRYSLYICSYYMVWNHQLNKYESMSSNPYNNAYKVKHLSSKGERNGQKTYSRRPIENNQGLP